MYYIGLDIHKKTISGSGYYAGSFSYNSPGNLTGFAYGNGVSAALGYSAPRTQLSSLTYALGNQTYFNLGYWFQQNSPNCPTGTSRNNGSIQCITDSVDGGRSVNFSYDSLGRVATAKTNGSSGYPQWGLSESYDRYGNRLSQTVTAGSGPSSSLTFSSNNQPVGYTFDSSGNMTVEPFSPPNNMTYNGENRMTAFSGNGGAASFTYDGNGMRVVKSTSGGTTTVSIFAGSSVIAEYDNGVAPASPSREFIYNPAGGATTGLLAMISGGATIYYHQDHLSVRLITNSSGAIVTQDGSFPFGESWYQSGTTNKWRFTSYQRDSESGLDYALARYYDSRTGTFCSADPLAGSPGDPQSWNRYPYGRNDPVTVTDPSGRSWSSFFEHLGQDLLNILLPGRGAILGIGDAIADGGGPPPVIGFGSFGAGLPLGSSWNGTPIIPSGGLNSGVQRALGLPTMADVGGPIMNYTDPTAIGADALEMRLTLIRHSLTYTPCGAAFAAHNGADGKPFSTDKFIRNLKARLTQAPDKTHPSAPTAFARTNPTDWKIITLRPFYGLSPQDQAFTLFHEGAHSYFRIGDNNRNAFLNFRNFFANQGFVGNDNYGTHDFTIWLKKGCPPNVH